MRRVVVVAASAVVRAGLEALAASIPGVLVAAALPNYEGLDDLRPDVILTTESWQDAPETRLVLLSDHAQWTADAVRHGVRAVLSPDSPAEAILSAVDAALHDLAVVAPEDLADWLNGRTASAPEEVADLTARELEVLRLMADGAANKTIAWKLGVSEHTAKFHVASVLAKLGAASRAQAVSIGMRRGLIPL